MGSHKDILERVLCGWLGLMAYQPCRLFIYPFCRDAVSVFYSLFACLLDQVKNEARVTWSQTFFQSLFFQCRYHWKLRYPTKLGFPFHYHT